MATQLAAIDGREVVRCDKCRLVQFATRSEACRRCRTPYVDPQTVAAAPGVEALDPIDGKECDIGLAVWLMRKVLGLSQREFALRTGIVRTRVSAYENGRHDAKPETVVRIARALNVAPIALVAIATRGRGLRVPA